MYHQVHLLGQVTYHNIFNCSINDKINNSDCSNKFVCAEVPIINAIRAAAVAQSVKASFPQPTEVANVSWPGRAHMDKKPMNTLDKENSFSLVVSSKLKDRLDPSCCLVSGRAAPLRSG